MSLKYVEKARKILCIGRNYAAHIQELNNTPPQQPFFFLKPSLLVLHPDGSPFLVPRGVEVHHEVELAFVLNRDLKNLPELFLPEEALDAIDGYALAIDMTARNVQNEAKKKGLPWLIGKGFGTFLPLGELIPKLKIPDPYNIRLQLAVNGATKQDDLLSLMIFPIHKILSYMLAIMTLEKGDLILTGTPKGVGPVKAGDHVTASLLVGDDVVSALDFQAVEKDGPYVYRET